MLRIVFHRKNKMLLSLFKNKRVCDLLEKNYRIVCSAKNEVSENTKRLCIANFYHFDIFDIFLN